MKVSKLTVAIAATLGMTASYNAMALDLYVDAKTKQIFAEPGKGRVLLGEFEKVGATNPTLQPAPAATHEEVAAIKKDLELKTNEIKALSEHAEEESKPSNVHVKLDDGIHFATKDGNFTAGINGRLQIDSQNNVNQTNHGFAALDTSSTGAKGGLPFGLNDGMALRRARLGIEGTFFKNAIYKFEYDFTRAGSSLSSVSKVGAIGASTSSGVTDAYIGYNFSKPFSMKVGAFKEPFSLEEATSNRYLTFIQRNMAVDTFVDNLNTYKLGIGANYSTDRWLAATSLQTESVGASKQGTSVIGGDSSNRGSGTGDTSWEINGRVAGTPWFESKTKFLHVGASGTYIALNNNYKSDGSWSNGGISFANGIGNNVDRTAILNTGALSTGRTAGKFEADRVTRVGAETALVYGPFSAQTEYLRTEVNGKGYSNDGMDGYYGYATYFLTGESRNYKTKTGAWDRIKPNHNFDMKGGLGAWELALGYDYLNLNTHNIKGGQVDTVKGGINWYLNSHTRVMANYIHALDIKTAAVADATAKSFNHTELDMIETRVQLDW